MPAVAIQHDARGERRAEQEVEGRAHVLGLTHALQRQRGGSVCKHGGLLGGLHAVEAFRVAKARRQAARQHTSRFEAEANFSSALEGNCETSVGMAERT